MKFMVEKCTQIMSDLVLYCYGLGATRLQMDLVPAEDQTTLVLKADIDQLDPDILERLSRDLKQDRQKEVEEMYWSIVYDSSDPCEPTTIGMMLDNVEVHYENNVLIIEACRKN